jgi:hypothetical protein
MADPRTLVSGTTFARLAAGAAGFAETMRRAAQAARGWAGLQRHARETAGAVLLAARRTVDVDATVDADWISPVCRGFLCSSCRPDLRCAHRCHHEGNLR